jgi:3-oxoadipate enol-lactonase
MTVPVQSMLHTVIEGPPGALPVVLLHSICTSSELWRPQLPAWSDHFRIYRMDLPGHGRSAALGGKPTVRDFANSVGTTLDEYGVRHAALVGISLGAMVAQAFALEYPERTIGMVIAHAGALTPPAAKTIWGQRLVELSEQGLEPHVTGTLARWFTEDFASRSPLTLAWVERLIRETSLQGYREAVGAIQNLNHSARLHELRMPTLVIGGKHDKAVTSEVASRVAEGIPAAQFALLDAAHIGNVETPVEFAEVAGRFLATLNAGRQL